MNLNKIEINAEKISSDEWKIFLELVNEIYDENASSDHIGVIYLRYEKCDEHTVNHLNSMIKNIQERDFNKENVYKLYTNSNSKKTLKIENQKDITSWQDYAIRASIIQAHDILLPLYYQDFIQIYLYRKPDSLSFDQVHESTICLSYANMEQISGIFDITYFNKLDSGDNIVDFIRKKINLNYYFTICMDLFFLKCKKGYKTHHGFYKSLIYGYDDSNKLFLGLGFDINNNYTFIQFGYEEILWAFEYGKVVNPFTIMGYFQRIRDDIYDYRYSPQNVINTLNDYRYPEKRRTTDRVFGLETYDALIKAFKDCLTDECLISYQNIHLFCEHKKLISDRLKYFNNHLKEDVIDNKLINEYYDIYRNMNIIRMIFLKSVLIESNYRSFYSPIKNPEKIRDIIARLEVLANKEKQILDKILKDLGTAKI